MWSTDDSTRVTRLYGSIKAKSVSRVCIAQSMRAIVEARERIALITSLVNVLAERSRVGLDAPRAHRSGTRTGSISSSFGDACQP